LKTTILALTILILLGGNLCIAADNNDNPLPEDVTAFVERRDGCDHFRGEYPYDEDRRKFLHKNMIE
jgi:hypothetical protein